MFDGLKLQMSFGFCASLFDSCNVWTISECAKFNTKMGNKLRKDIGISSAAKFVHYYYLLNNYMMILKYLS